MIVHCEHCHGEITSSNRRWPGYCTAGCRNRAAYERQQARQAQRARRLEARLARETARRGAAA